MPLSTIDSNSLNTTSDLVINGVTVGKGTGSVSTNTAVGASALAGSNTGGFNNAVGTSALAVNTSGGGNAAYGWSALALNTTGSNNTAIGASGMPNNTTGSSNVSVGVNALQNNSTASNNTAVGYQAGYTATLSSYNVFLGYQAGYSHNLGSAGNGLNTFVGQAAGYNVTTGTKNTIIGTYNGNQGGLNITTSSNYIVLSDGDGNPRQIIDNSGNTGFGATPSAWQNTFKAIQIGNGAAVSSYGTSEAALTANAYYASGQWRYINNDVAMRYVMNAGGHQFQLGATGTAGNVIGFSLAFEINSSGRFTTGTLSGSPYNTGVSNATKALYVDATGILGYNSSIRAAKTNINLAPTADWLQQLEIVTFNYRKRDENGGYTDDAESELRWGVIADDALSVAPGFCSTNTSGEIDGFHYDRLVPVLVKAIQELKAEFDAYKEAHP